MCADATKENMPAGRQAILTSQPSASKAKAPTRTPARPVAFAFGSGMKSAKAVKRGSTVASKPCTLVVQRSNKKPTQVRRPFSLVMITECRYLMLRVSRCLEVFDRSDNGRCPVVLLRLIPFVRTGRKPSRLCSRRELRLWLAGWRVSSWLHLLETHKLAVHCIDERPGLYIKVPLKFAMC